MPIIKTDMIKRKKYHGDDVQWDREDALGINQAKSSKARTIEADKASDNAVHKFLCMTGDHKMLIGRTAYCITDKNESMNGKIADVIPPDYIMIKGGRIARFKDVITIGD